MKPLVLCLVLLGLAACASAQIVQNPTTIQFTHADFATVDSYTVGYFSSASATAPVQTAVFPKPGTCAPCAGPLPSRPTAYQTWYVGVQAVAGTVTSAWSAPLVPFGSVPVAPANIVVK